MTTSLSQAYLDRFSGIARLYGNSALEALASAHFAVIGLGGVGSWTAEALARSGVGRLTLIEMDEVCVTNSNRQLHALTGNVGQSKNAVISARLKQINPEIELHTIEDFIERENISELIGQQHHVVIDAMDAAHTKAAIVAYCSKAKIRLVTVGSSGGKRNPEMITVRDLGKTESDPLLGKIRHQLYRTHNFTRDAKRKFRVDAVFSREQMVYPKPDGRVCQEKQDLQSGVKLDCAGGFGASLMVTGTFGFLAAAKAIERYLERVDIPVSKNT